MELCVMQREHEQRRLTVPGKRTDNGERCSLVVVCEVGGTCALYPHGADQLGVRVTATEAARVAQVLVGRTVS